MGILSKITKPAKELKRKQVQKKAYKKIKKNLEANPELLNAKRDSFERAFGKDRVGRTRKQWCRLVNTYGIKTVCESEKMTEDEVVKKCNEKFSDRVRNSNLKKVE